MNKLKFISLLILVPLLSPGQRPVKSVYGELGGPGIFLSANYDTRLANSNKGLGVRAGVGTIFDQYSLGFTLPVGLNYLLGKEKNFLELGVGASYIHFIAKNQDGWFNFKKENFVATYGWIGYRYQPPKNGFTFRAGLCPFFNDINFPNIAGSFMYAGLSFGYSFQ